MAESAPVFIDSSCFVALALSDSGPARLRSRIARASARYASTLAEAELMTALTSEGLAMGAADVPGVDWISPARRLTGELARAMSGGYVRGADAWHLACSLFLDPDANELAFLTLDRRQREVARVDRIHGCVKVSCAPARMQVTMRSFFDWRVRAIIRCDGYECTD